MSGDEMAGILYPEMAFDCGFKEITELSCDRQSATDDQERQYPRHAGGGKSGRNQKAHRKSADRAGPGLVRTDARPEFWTADAAAGKIGPDVGGPDDQKDKDQSDKAELEISTKQHRGKQRDGRIDKSRNHPAATLRRDKGDAQQSEHAQHQGRVQSRERKAQSGHCKSHHTRCDDAPLARGARDRQPFDIEPDDCERDEGGPQDAACISGAKRKGHQHRSGEDALQKIARRWSRKRRHSLTFAHDAVFAARPPKRRSRLEYSTMALSKAALSKSGQCIGTNTSSL